MGPVQRALFFMPWKKKQKASESLEEIKETMLKKFEEYDRKFGDLSHTAKVCIGISLGLSFADTIILIKILKKIK